MKVGGIYIPCQGERSRHDVFPLGAYLDPQHQAIPGWKRLIGWGMLRGAMALHWQATPSDPLRHVQPPSVICGF
jgi:hypothetical protein